MVDYNNINRFIKSVKRQEGIGNKERLSKNIQKEFDLNLDRKIYYCDDFAVRFLSSKKDSNRIANTTTSFENVKKYDARPLFICIVAPTMNFLCLANATFVKRVGYSSKKLETDHITGSINFPDIMKEYQGISNNEENYKTLFEIHAKIGFSGNLQRIVNATKNRKARGKRFVPTPEQRQIILKAPDRAYDFLHSSTYADLKADLDAKTESVKEDIQLIKRQYSHDVKLRGNLVEHFIKSSDEKQKKELREKIKKSEVIEDLTVENGLGDYSIEKDGYHIEIDIKSKVTTLNSAPKGYNVDKLLEFLSDPASIFLLYIVSISEGDNPKTELASIFQKQIMDKTNIQHHWAGINSRGVAQFEGHSLEYFLEDSTIRIEIEKARKFLEKLLDEN